MVQQHSKGLAVAVCKFIFVILCLSASTFADTNVPVPDPIKETPGTIMFHGVAGAGQERNKLWIEPLSKDKNGSLVRASTGESMAYDLNDTITLPPGTYKIVYSHTLMFIDLAAGETKSIELKKISVPKIDGTYSVSLFADLTNSDEYKKRLQSLWSQGYNRGAWNDGTNEGSDSSVVPGYPIPPALPRDSIRAICHTKNSKWRGVGANACAAWMAPSYEGLSRGAVKADKDANLWMVDFEYEVDDVGKNNIVISVRPVNDQTLMKNFGRRQIGQGVDGDFFSALPGAYGLEFRSLKGKVSTQMGIVIN